MVGRAGGWGDRSSCMVGMLRLGGGRALPQASVRLLAACLTVGCFLGLLQCAPNARATRASMLLLAICSLMGSGLLVSGCGITRKRMWRVHLYGQAWLGPSQGGTPIAATNARDDATHYEDGEEHGHVGSPSPPRRGWHRRTGATIGAIGAVRARYNLCLVAAVVAVAVARGGARVSAQRGRSVVLICGECV